MKFVDFADSERVPALGMGTWEMGDRRAARQEEIACLQHGIDLGMSLIDTAEMYGDGAAEKLVGEAIEAFERLKRDGKIRHWGVSNLDAVEMDELHATPGGTAVAANQVLYNLSRRGVEWSLLPWCVKHRIPLMAYSPIEQARLLRDRRLIALAAELGKTSAQIALAWLLSRNAVIAIPKAASRAHLDENFGALECALDRETLAKLDEIFPPPQSKKPLEMI